MTKIKDLPKILRPREKLVSKGPKNLKDEELLAILLRTGRKGKNVLEIAKQILRKCSKKRLLQMRYEDLTKIEGINKAKACTILAAAELVQRALKVKDETLPIVHSTRDIVAQVSNLRNRTREHFVALYLNARKELVFKKCIFIGTLDANIIHPREIFEHALLHHAASIILAHNHPSGDSKPSEADLRITKQISQAGKIMGVDVLDHVIITKSEVFSFKEQRLI